MVFLCEVFSMKAIFGTNASNITYKALLLEMYIEKYMNKKNSINLKWKIYVLNTCIGDKNVNLKPNQHVFITKILSLSDWII